MENATAITAVSQEGLHRARIVSACPDKGRVILNSIIPEDFTDGIQDLQLPRPLIGSLAVFKNKKGLEVLADQLFSQVGLLGPIVPAHSTPPS